MLVKLALRLKGLDLLVHVDQPLTVLFLIPRWRILKCVIVADRDLFVFGNLLQSFDRRNSSESWMIEEKEFCVLNSISITRSYCECTKKLDRFTKKDDYSQTW